MTYQAAHAMKQAITKHTGYLARVHVSGNQFQAAPILPETEKQLSSLQHTAMYIIYVNARGEDKGCNVSTALESGVFDCRAQALQVLRNLAACGWLIETAPTRFSLTEQGSNFIKRHIGETI